MLDGRVLYQKISLLFTRRPQLITTTMPTTAELKAKFEAEKAERQRREDEERAREAEMLREIAEAEEAERKAAEKAEQERLEREKKLLEEARVALAAKELVIKRRRRRGRQLYKRKRRGLRGRAAR